MMLGRNFSLKEHFPPQGRRRNWIGILSTFVTTSLCYLLLSRKLPATSLRSLNFSTPGDLKVHFLVTANNPGLDLCKTLATAAALEFPPPIVLAWQQVFDQRGLLGGGSHLAKVWEVLNYISNLTSDKDDDLVILVDAYDVWFQLPMQVLISRYHDINAKANERATRRFGREPGSIGKEQTIVFAAGKRCAPNQLHTVACYPVPIPPTSMNLYSENTDTIIGRNKYYSHRQRYLNSGYIIGPVRHMRLLFERAAQLIHESELQHQDPQDNGSHGSDMLYHGSDQSIFNTIFGQQEYEREVYRRSTGFSSWLRKDAVDGLNTMEGTVIDDVLNPSFTHEIFTADPNVDYEYHIGLDYHSDLGHQTANSEVDARYLLHDRDLLAQIHDRNEFDCPFRTPFAGLDDVLTTTKPYHLLDPSHELHTTTWPSVSLYSHLCYGTIPVMIHHNGDKSARERDWNKLWLQPQLNGLLRAASILHGNSSVEYDVLPTHTRPQNGIASTLNGTSLGWKELCPTFASEEGLST